MSFLKRKWVNVSKLFFFSKINITNYTPICCIQHRKQKKPKKNLDLGNNFLFFLCFFFIIFIPWTMSILLTCSMYFPILWFLALASSVLNLRISIISCLTQRMNVCLMCIFNNTLSNNNCKRIMYFLPWLFQFYIVYIFTLAYHAIYLMYIKA